MRGVRRVRVCARIARGARRDRGGGIGLRVAGAFPRDSSRDAIRAVRVGIARSLAVAGKIMMTCLYSSD